MEQDEGWRKMHARIISKPFSFAQYDFVSIVEAPNDEAMARFALAPGAQGNIRTETMRDFTEDEYRKIIGSLP